MKANARVYFSFRSPYSWMAVERLTRAIPRIHDRAEFSPYWEPDERTLDALQKRGADIRYAAMSKAKHLYILQDTKRLATRLGMRIAWPVDIKAAVAVGGIESNSREEVIDIIQSDNMGFVEFGGGEGYNPWNPKQTLV